MVIKTKYFHTALRLRNADGRRLADVLKIELINIFALCLVELTA
ncbi:hypothetical protein VRK_11660 [Vibrio sp. MEBiC08052]|nr:hypothetical protein VRK_11660 [Vibrio sp. MEBiC08052]